MNRIARVLLIIATASSIVTLGSTLGACSKPKDDDCKKAVANIRRLYGTDGVGFGATPDAAIRSCRGSASRESVQCVINAQTIADLQACEGSELLGADPAGKPQAAPAGQQPAPAGQQPTPAGQQPAPAGQQPAPPVDHATGHHTPDGLPTPTVPPAPAGQPTPTVPPTPTGQPAPTGQEPVPTGQPTPMVPPAPTDQPTPTGQPAPPVQ